jgi:hypothetical protein
MSVYRRSKIPSKIVAKGALVLIAEGRNPEWWMKKDSFSLGCVYVERQSRISEIDHGNPDSEFQVDFEPGETFRGFRGSSIGLIGCARFSAFALPRAKEAAEQRELARFRLVR